MIFLDASALVKAYLDEAGDASVRGLLKRASGLLFVSDFVALEVLTAIRSAFRGKPKDQYLVKVGHFWKDYWSRFSVVEVDHDTVVAAIDLTTRHATTKARSMDMLHLATALELQDSLSGIQVVMVTSDQDLADLCKASGLRTFDPSRDPLAALLLRPR